MPHTRAPLVLVINEIGSRELKGIWLEMRMRFVEWIGLFCVGVLFVVCDGHFVFSLLFEKTLHV